MTKRAGKRQYRMGTQRHPPGPTEREPTIERDDLPPAESLKLELNAINTWTVNTPEFAQYRQALMVKAMLIALKSDASAKTVVSALRSVAHIEMEEKRLELQRQTLEQRANELPTISVEVNQQTNIEPYMLIQQLIARNDVRDAASGNLRPNITDQPRAVVDSGPVQDGSSFAID